MNIGSCPYEDCSGTITLAVPERTPAYTLVECEECKREIWYRLSRLDPQAWTKEEFERLYAVNAQTGLVLLKDIGNKVHVE